MKFPAATLVGLSAVPLGSADWTYKSRPDLSPPRLNITVPASALVETGYLFVAPYGDSREGTPQQGPYIFDTAGELLWSGFGYFAPVTANFQPARWRGHGDVLLAFEGAMNRYRGHGHGHHKIMDTHYQTIREVRSGGPYLSDMHEFHVVNERTALVGSYTPREMDLKLYGGDEDQTWVIEYILQEVDIETGDVLFEWHSLEHTSPGESLLPIGSQAGSAHNSSSAWDYLHINSIDKGTDGHYIASARSASTIYKINGTDGSVIWRLGGKFSDFTLGPGVEFFFQHHARYIPGTGTQDGSTATISLFDNSAGLGSSGKIISLDFTKKTATLEQVFLPPHGRIFAFSQGSAQVLPGGGVLVNWGSENQVTEFSGDGGVLFHAFLESGTRQGGERTQNYRAFRGNWTGFSPERPAVVAEEHGGDDGTKTTSVWVSWNGDTQTAYWRFRWTRLTARGVEQAASRDIRRTGFETRFDLPSDESPLNGISVEALGDNGNVLVRSGTIKVVRSGLGGIRSSAEQEWNYERSSAEATQKTMGPPPSEL